MLLSSFVWEYFSLGFNDGAIVKDWKGAICCASPLSHISLTLTAADLLFQYASQARPKLQQHYAWDWNVVFKWYALIIKVPLLEAQNGGAPERRLFSFVHSDILKSDWRDDAEGHFGNFTSTYLFLWYVIWTVAERASFLIKSWTAENVEPNWGELQQWQPPCWK